MAAKVVNIKKGGRTPQLSGQKTNNTQGNPKIIKKVVVPKSRKYKKAPPPPKQLSEAGRAYWRDRAPELVKNNRLNRDTVSLFFQLCEIWGRWLEFLELEAERRKNETSIIDGAKVAKSAKNAEEAEKHFYKTFEKFNDISAPYEKKPGGRNPHAMYERMK